MSKNPLDHLVTNLKARHITRRQFTQGAGAIGISGVAAAAIANHALAQATSEASPVASPVGEAMVLSPKREDVETQLREAFGLEEAGNTEGQLVYSQGSDITGLNPTLIQDIYSGYVAGALYDGLVNTSPIDGSLSPGLADSWELAGDGVTYTFHLNPNVTWHDGTPFTADDVIFNFDSVVDETSLSPRRSTVMNALKSYRKIDDHTVEMVATGPLADFVSDTCNQFQIVPKHVWEQYPFAEWGASPANTGEDPTLAIGTGPFKLVERVIGESVTMTRNDAYWDTPRIPSLKDFIYRVVPDDNSAVQSLRTGESDVVSLPSSQVEPLKTSNPELVIDSFDSFYMIFYQFLLEPDRGLPMLDVGVRQALMYAIDRNLIAETVYQGLAVGAIGTQPVISPAYAPDKIRSRYEFDPAMATSLLEEAGWVDTDGDGIREKDGEKFSFEFLYDNMTTENVQLVPYLQQAWREVGVEMTASAVPFPTLVENLVGGNYDSVLIGSYWDTTGNQDAMYSCQNWTPNGFNAMHYCNPAYDELDKQQKAELDPAKRVEMQIELSNMVTDEQANSVICFTKSSVGSQARLHNFHPNGYGLFWSLSYVWAE